MPDNEQPRLRGNARRRNGPYNLGEIPDSVVIGIARGLAHRMAVGQADITGDDFARIFAKAISGQHRDSPLGIADVEFENCAWTIKTVKGENPLSQNSLRAISGRNSPLYSHGIENPKTDIQATGRAVLEIWNSRVDESASQFEELRIFAMIRNMSARHFCLMEFEAVRYVASEYKWALNKRGNLEGFHKSTQEHAFTWQPHGSQFTVMHHVPASAYRFKITQQPVTLEEHQVIHLSRFQDSWVQKVEN